jgi:dipeptidyl aminopeptidase/acylaminoacyl peptidase
VCEHPPVQFNPPSAAAPTTDERELLLRFLHRQREEVVTAADGLTEAQARWTPDGRLLPIIGIVNHLAHVEWRWIDGRYLGHAFPPRDEEFRVGDDLTLAGAIDAYGERAVRTAAVVRAAAGLGEPCLGCEGDGPPAHVLLGLDQPLDLRWAVLHLIEETARHAGHADATREMLDGRTKS